jgi:acyl carrier protein
MESAPWPPQFEAILRTYLPLLPDGQQVTPELALADYGLDSLATVNLLLDLEDQYAVSIPDDLLTSTNFANAAALWSVLERAGGAPAAGSVPEAELGGMAAG